MANFGEMSGIKQWAVAAGGAALVTAGLYFTVFKSERDQNAAAQAQLESKRKENAELEAYRPKLADIERQLASLKQQLEIERRIVPDEKEVDGFMKMLDAEACKAGIEIRRYTAQPSAQQGFLYRSSIRNGTRRSLLFDAGFLRSRGQAGTHRERLEPAGGDHPQALGREGEENVSVRTE